MKGIYCIILLQFIYSDCLGEIPRTICGNPNIPYKLQENQCSNFYDICVMKEEIVCWNYLRSCSNCSLVTQIKIFDHIIQNIEIKLKMLMKKNKKLEKINAQLNTEICNLTNQIYQIKIQNNNPADYSKIIIIIIGLTHFIIIGFLIVPQIIPLLPSSCTKTIYEQRLEKKRTLTEAKTIVEKLENYFTPDNMEKLTNLIKIKPVHSESLIKFQMKDSNEPMKLCIKHCQNIVQIKKQICSELSNANDNNYKIMRLKYNENILDDNRYLLPYITDRNIPVECEIDHSINDQEIVMVMDGDINVPKLLQLHRNKTIGDFRRIISIFTDNFDYFIVKESKIKENESQNIKLEIMKDESTIGECKLSDGDSVKIIKKKSGKISVKSILKENECFVTEYSNTELVSTISAKLADKFGSDPNDFQLFLNNECLDGDKKIFEYNIDEKSKIKYYCYTKIADKLEVNEVIDKGNFYTIHKGRNKLLNRDSLIMKCELSEDQRRKYKLFSNGFSKYSILKSYPKFVHLFGLYYDENYLYVSLECLSGRTLRTVLTKNLDVTENKIIIWSKQIVECIEFLHNNSLSFGDITLTDILIDERENLRFNSFCLCEYLSKKESSNKNIGTSNSSNDSLLHLPWEIKSKEETDFQKDVLSFGELLVDIVNCKNSTASVNLYKTDPVEIDKNKQEILPFWRGTVLKDLIQSCLTKNPNERPTIQSLLQSRLFKN